MATNFEFYKDQILGIAKRGSLAVCNDEPVSCGEIQCTGCLFEREEYGCAQGRELFEWLYAEHIEQPKLTKRERAFCEVVQTGWIARDRDASLCWFPNDAIVQKTGTMWNAEKYVCISHFELPFESVKWENEKPWAVTDLLKLEVVEE